MNNLSVLQPAYIIHSEQEMLALGKRLSRCFEASEIIYLQGDLGVGKTTLVRGILRGLQYNRFVKSPTYTLIEEYMIGSWHVVHIDLYRLTDLSELEHLGLSDYWNFDTIVLIEWPEKAEALLPTPTLRCQIEMDGEKRGVSLTFYASL